MGRRGPAPSGNRSRERDNKATTKLVSDGVKRGRGLPQLRNADGRVEKWHPWTVTWWNAWRLSPQAVRMMTEPDWNYLLETALIHHEFCMTRDKTLAAELRLRETQLGAHPDARARLGVEIGTGVPEAASTGAPAASVPTAPAGNVTDINDRRDRLADDPSTGTDG